EIFLTKEERLEAAKGTPVKIQILVQKADPSDAEKALLKNLPDGWKSGDLLKIRVLKQIGDAQPVEMSRLNKAM
ncbi:hypothetical protein, partial [Streptococcus parasanguinis]